MPGGVVGNTGSPRPAVLDDLVRRVLNRTKQADAETRRRLQLCTKQIKQSKSQNEALQKENEKLRANMSKVERETKEGEALQKAERAKLQSKIRSQVENEIARKQRIANAVGRGDANAEATDAVASAKAEIQTLKGIALDLSTILIVALFLGIVYLLSDVGYKYASGDNEEYMPPS